MTSVSLTSQEKKAIPNIHLHTDAKVLNEFVKNTHRQINHQQTIQRHETKAKELKAVQQKTEFNKIFEPQIKENKKSISVNNKETEEVCTTKHLTRILICLDELCLTQDKVNIKQIGNFTCLTNKQINDGLKFLVNNKIIKEIREKGWYYYSR